MQPTSATFAWDEMILPPDQWPVVGYVIQMYAGNESYIKVIEGSNNTRLKVINLLPCSSDYKFCVAALSETASGDFSPTVSLTTPSSRMLQTNDFHHVILIHKIYV